MEIILLFGIIFGTVLFIRYAWGLSIQKELNSAFALLKTHEKDILDAVSGFDQLLFGDRYFTNKQYQNWKEKYQKFSDKIALPSENLKTADPLREKLITFSRYYNNGRLDIDKHNFEFSNRESELLKKALVPRNIPANRDQLIAAVSEEDNTLVVAGAGTGKTTTILGKLAYLTDRLRISPEDILLLSFTGKAVEELESRVKKCFGDINIEVRTFHGFGLSVLGKVLGLKPSIAFENSADRQEWINVKFEKLLATPNYLKFAVNYFAYLFKPYDAKPRFNNLDEYYKYIKTERVITFQKEFVKSQQEAMIANFLYLHCINYMYEHPYKFKTADQNYMQYRPDFYLPDYDIYIEHFGIDREGNVNFVPDDLRKNIELGNKYRSDMEWKRNLHRKHQTRLIETFSYEFSERDWEEKLLDKLKEQNVVLKQRSYEEVLPILRQGGQILQIANLFLTFLDLAKSNHYSVQHLIELVGKRGNHRESAFIDLFIPIYQEYENHLQTTEMIDFHDMLNRATEFINEGRHPSIFKYIIIDEFQDFSVSKNHLVRALCDKNPEAKLFCVGDDWQSIYRFAGSDVSLMTNFEKYHGYTNNLRLTMTNRFDSKLAKITNAFIMKNPYQIKKDISAAYTLPHEPIEIIINSAKEKSDFVDRVLDMISREVGSANKTATVLLLGRYKRNKPANLSYYERTYKNLKIDFLTVHRSKGLEADYVIILDVVRGKYGFPSDIADDPILEIVLSEGESFLHAEERRLMYVALTRARKKVFVMTVDGRLSIFVSELSDDFKKENKALICGSCGGVMVMRRGQYGQFYGCSNYPYCDYKIKI